MKKYLFMAMVAISVMLSGCGPKTEEVVNGAELQGIKISPSEVTLEEGESVKLRVRYVPEEAQETAPAVQWYSEKQRVASVSNEGVVTAGREGTTVITAVCGKFEARCTVEVTQLELPNPQPDPEINFSVSPELINAPAKGGTFDITVTTDTTWTARCEQSWAQLSQTEGKGNATIQVTVDPSETVSTVSQNIIFKVGRGTYYVTIQRKGCVLAISPESIDVPVEGGEYTVEVTTDAESWDVTCETEGVTITKYENTATIKVDVSKKLYNGTFASTKRVESIPVEFSDGRSTAKLILKQESPYIRVTERCDLTVTDASQLSYTYSSGTAYKHTYVNAIYETNMILDIDEHSGWHLTWWNFYHWDVKKSVYADYKDANALGAPAEWIVSTDFLKEPGSNDEKVSYSKAENKMTGKISYHVQVPLASGEHTYAGECTVWLKLNPKSPWANEVGDMKIELGKMKYQFTYDL